MNINHRMTASSNSEFYRAIKALGIEFEDGAYTSVLNITEDHPKWNRAKELMHEFDISSMVQNEFSKKEILSAEWLEIGATGHFGYPQPESNYEEVTYDLRKACPSCGIGKTQRAAFRFRSDPRKNRSQFFQLNWVFDEFFVRPEVKELFASNNITGITYENPVLSKSNDPITSIFQMKVEHIQNSCLITSNLEPVTCKLVNEESNPSVDIFCRKREAFCSKVKFHAGKRGPFKFARNNFNCNFDIVKSFEWFGSGFQAFRIVLISHKVADLIMKSRWRGLLLEPVELV